MLSRSLLVAAGFWALPLALPAQSPPKVGGRSEVFAGSELENYLRTLQDVGVVPLYPWSVRGFSPGELDRLVPPDSTHPWAARYDLTPHPIRRIRVDVIRPSVTLIANTSFPFGDNDGPVWAGKGLTTVFQAGVAVRYGPISATVAPLLFRAQNAAFRLMPNGETGRLAFADGQGPRVIDRPQRFGDRPYGVLDPGQSALQLDVAGFSVGVSTAGQVWGPADRSPLILGVNAAGIPRVFVGTSRPVNAVIGRLHGRLIYGVLSQSAYSSVVGAGSRRFAAGWAVTLLPRGISGLELGAARFFHRAWPEGGLGWRDFAWPFQAILKTKLRTTTIDSLNPNEDPDNQLASVFIRWIVPRSGFELYCEFAREDHAWDARDLLIEPDHSGGYTIGFRKAWSPSRSRVLVARGETMNAQISTLGRGRGEGPFYEHTRTAQGHTNHGQILGAPDGYGGASSTLAVDSYSPRGRWSVAWIRTLRAADWRGRDVAHLLSVDGTLFWGRIDLSVGVSVIQELNRDFQHDSSGLHAFVGVKSAWPLGGR